MSFILYKCLLDAAVILDYIYKSVYNPVFESHYNIKITKSYICINKNNFLSLHRQTCAKIGSRSCLSNTAFSGCDDDDAAHNHSS